MMLNLVLHSASLRQDSHNSALWNISSTLRHHNNSLWCHSKVTMKYMCHPSSLWNKVPLCDIMPHWGIAILHSTTVLNCDNTVLMFSCALKMPPLWSYSVQLSWKSPIVASRCSCVNYVDYIYIYNDTIMLHLTSQWLVLHLQFTIVIKSIVIS